MRCRYGLCTKFLLLHCETQTIECEVCNAGNPRSTNVKRHRCAKHMGRGEYIADVTITPRILGRYVSAGPITPGDTRDNEQC